MNVLNYFIIQIVPVSTSHMIFATLIVPLIASVIVFVYYRTRE
jgi:hypothetical protein